MKKDLQLLNALQGISIKQVNAEMSQMKGTTFKGR